MKIRALLACCLVLSLPGLAHAGKFVPIPQDGVPDEYIVVFQPPSDGEERERRNVPALVERLQREHGGEVLRVWEDALEGFHVRLPEAAARALAKNPLVQSVEQDRYISAPTADCRDNPNPAGRVYDTLPVTSPQTISCSNPADTCTDNWGLDRLDNWTGLNGQYFFGNTGAGVHVYVLDTGIRTDHQEFTGRIGTGVNTTVPTTDPNRTNVTDDFSNGHGTHVAGIIGGKYYGVAKGVTIHPVKVFSRPTYNSQLSYVIDGVNWVMHNRVLPAVANLSGANFEWSGDTAFQSAVRNLIRSGVVFVQSAGNFRDDACTRTLAMGVPEVIVAGGSDWTDRRWDNGSGCTSVADCGSSYGGCVDIWAPAARVVSASHKTSTAYCQMSGTSMAAPHVSGLAVLYLQSNPNAGHYGVATRLVERSRKGLMTWASGSASETCSPNRLLSTTPVGPASGCAHRECDIGPKLTNGCSSCVSSVCAVDPYCCNNFWDYICTERAKSSCGTTCSGCAHSEWTTGAALTKSCSSCAATVCDSDSYCCTNSWDSMCVQEAKTWCGSCLPELTVNEITRNNSYYYIQYCNWGGTSSGTFGFSTRNVNTNQTFTSSAVYPVPPTGSCAWTGGLTCGLIGSNCQDVVTIESSVDGTSLVIEANEENNTKRRSFP